jgi:cell division GTPase FtsZ
VRLLTIGAGFRAAKVVELMSKKGVKINRVPLFKCYVVLNNEKQFASISMSESRKFYVHGVDVSGVVSNILKVPDIVEGSLIVTSLEDDFGYLSSLELCKKLRELTEDVVISLAIIPRFDVSSIGELRKRIREIRNHSDILLLFEGKPDVEYFILRAMNLISLAGEIDLKKKIAGEVVVDTSDVFNALRGEGFSVIGYASRRVPLDLKRVILRRKSELKAMRTKRMVDLTRQALENLSINGDITSAKSALLLFAANPSELTMEGMFSSVSLIEELNDRIVVRYGDYPLLRSRKMAVVTLFSGIKKFRFV